MTLKDWGKILGVLFVGWIIFVFKWSLPILPDPPRYAPGAGLTYATELARNSNRLATAMMFSGWLLVLAGGIFAFAASLVGPATPAKPPTSIIGTIREQQGLLCAATAIILAGIGWQLTDRYKAANQVTSAATRAIAVSHEPDGDLRAYNIAIEAKVAWLDGRMNFDRLQRIVGELGQLRDNGDTTTPPTDDGDQKADDEAKSDAVPETKDEQLPKDGEGLQANGPREPRSPDSA